MRRRLGSLEKGGGMVPRDAQDSDRKRSSSKSIDDLSDEEASEFLGALKAYVRANAPALLLDPNVTSVGIGYRTIKGKPQTKDGKPVPAIQFTVKKKAAAKRKTAALAAELVDLSSTEIPATLPIELHANHITVNVETDVVEREYAPSCWPVAQEEMVTDERKQRHAVLKPGISVGHPDISAGTLGAIVYDATSGEPCALSNWHVLHAHSGSLGDPMLQPGKHDDDRINLNRAGTLVRSHLGAAGDCAIARIEGRDIDEVITGLFVRVESLAYPELGDRLVKSGRTTAITHGIVRRIETTAKIRYAGVGEQLIGCFEIGPDEEHPAPANEISKGGDSGSVWLAVDETGAAMPVMVGLHFGGEGPDNPDEHALACYAHAVFQKLEVETSRERALVRLAETDSPAGFDLGFLSIPLRHPWLGDDVYHDAFKLNGMHRIQYTHFTVCLSQSRRLARYVAWNVDGANPMRVPRDGSFRFDQRIGQEFQTGNELYRRNPLDRGHLARRAALTWGTRQEAERANRDSFFYTNIAPQHEAFNQSSLRGLWGELENTVLDQAQAEASRVSVFGGPIFHDDDPLYRGFRVPRSFWKIIVYVGQGAEPRLRAHAYILSQADLLTELPELDLDPFSMWQVQVEDLQSQIDLDFNLPAGADTMPAAVGPEDLLGRRSRQIRTEQDLILT